MSKLVPLIRSITQKGSASGTMYIGHVVQRSAARPDALKIQTSKMVLDRNLKKYFSGRKFYWAEDNSNDCLIGDIVLIRSLPKNLDKKRVTHKVDRVVYKLGCVVDPVTGRRCRGTEFEDEADKGTEKPLVIEEIK
ncbi:28S ribosomal protein S17, mitochondrial-like isoform X2 [Pecten maximus]|uniref:28S ribosomal protein S17, mitochondrial-like isoform X1 n=1 Tax=Pecten maximus TaxID=6579 RepID=UPI001458C3A2|nr:28S ribosomal protein S17, mitochondrial-like isoform X1 [Pecten maximus]XP_033753959.1 28S ribosomal protein S17, mitochondrial-like isoform X2 [Pecten maximus]